MVGGSEQFKSKLCAYFVERATLFATLQPKTVGDIFRPNTGRDLKRVLTPHQRNTRRQIKTSNIQRIWSSSKFISLSRKISLRLRRL